MTKIRRDAIKLLEQIPEDKLIFIIQIMQGMNGLYKEDDMKEREKALRSLARLRRKMPEIDYDRE
ncbi:MAG TPA: UDP-N-acetylenolpyruvoylglucosamine reductase [Candidatus Mediterraneibacter merdavium]|nr:UDP-N-acetylenolpyruvoylglucosamine reductase [Candidatus Mediterraneibacter merdavium]